MNRIAVILFILLSILYIHNLAPDWGAMAQFNTWDGLEYIISAYLLGIDHPPGHPLYMLLGKAMTLLPFGNPSWNINLLSALFGAIGASFLYLLLACWLKGVHKREDPPQKIIPLSVSLTFAFSYVFWSHCEIPEVHTMFIALVAAAIYFYFRWQLRGGRAIYLSGLSLALALGVNILGSISIIIPFMIFAFLSKRALRLKASIAMTIFIFLTGFLLYLYYPVRLKNWPMFSHPMNYLCPHGVGSASWYLWYISGKAWTGGSMFFLHRIVTNIPLYVRFALRDLGIVFFILSLLGIALSMKSIKSTLASIFKGFNKAERDGLLISFMLILLIFLIIPEISIHDPSNPRAYEYLMNFFLPSLLLLAFFGGFGASAVCSYLISRSRPLYTVFLILLCAMPIYQLFANFKSCDLRNNNAAYIYSRETLQQIPSGTVIVSKLVYLLVDTYFSEVERVIPPDKVSLYDPELITRRLSKHAGTTNLFSLRNKQMLGDINEFIMGGRSVYLAGDIVDEDKSPEKLLISDLDFKIWQPKLAPDIIRLTYPRELFLYHVRGLRKASILKDLPEGIERGIANDGRFANGLQLLGFRLNGQVMDIGREALNFDFYWKASSPITSALYAGLIFMDSRMNRIGEPCWHTLGGTVETDVWKTEEVIGENVNVYPPPIPPGSYFMALGLFDDRADEIRYIPADPRLKGREFDFVLLGHFNKEAPPPAESLPYPHLPEPGFVFPKPTPGMP